MRSMRRKMVASLGVAVLVLASTACSWSRDEEGEPGFRPLIVVDSTVNSTLP